MDPETSSQLLQSATTIRAWLDRCAREHPQSGCDSPFTGPKPKRLIYLEPSSTNRLIDTPSATPPYVALSYVWGPTSSNIRTLTSNLPQMYTSIPSDSLPLTLQHVFHLVRLLGFHYLWIDSLCIVQDDPDEKSVEIGRMEYVYLNSTLQISAMASPGAQAGLLQGRRQCGEEEREEHHLIMKACRSLRQRVWDGQLRRDYCLLTRGWAYQERILSRRIVHFTVSELVWECKACRWCECGMVEAPSKGVGNVINNMSAAFEECVRAGGDESGEDGYKRGGKEKTVALWRECVMGYSRGRLSLKDDRLAAISGVGRMLGGEFGEEAYVAGIRREGLPFELLWRADQSCGLPLEKARKPSWSWGSVDVGVDWPTNGQGGKTKATTEGEKSLAYVVSGTYFEEVAIGVEVVGLEAEPEGSSTTEAGKSVGFGPVRSAKLTLAARLVPVSIRRHESPESWHSSHDTYWAIGEDRNGLVLPFYPDVEFTQGQGLDMGVEKVLESSTGVQQYSLLEIASIVSDGRRWEAGLVVRWSLEAITAGCLERVGMAGFLQCVPQEGVQSWFDGARIGMVSIV